MAQDSRSLLKSVLDSKLGDRMLLILAHAQPYVHYRRGNRLECLRAKGGLVTALDPVLQHCGGIWVGIGQTKPDRDSADEQGFLDVPPWNPRYKLKRVFLNRAQWEGYFDGISIGGLWPLFHNVYVRPRFSLESWEHYLQVNRLMAQVVLDLIKGRDALIWIQDFHLALCAKFINQARPDVVTAHFWHIPWPSPEVFGILPWAEEILEAMLYSDLIGFQTRYYCNNFMDCVDRFLEARVDRSSSTIFYRGSQSLIMDFPISIDFQGISSISDQISQEDMQKLSSKYRINSEKIIVGIDRMDYTKGILEKMMGLNHLLKSNPELRGKLSLVQLASPTRTHIPEYIQYARRVVEMARDLNSRYSYGNWKPVILINKFIPYEEIIGLYKLGDICLVSSLHDGMNLSCKEYLAARKHAGSIVLSKFTGAAFQLKQAILINPYLPEQISQGIQQSLEADPQELNRRFQLMRQELQERDVYRWAAEFIAHIAKLESTVPRAN